MPFSAANHMLEARNIKKEFIEGDGVTTVFEHLDFTAQPGEFIVISGRSGSGKSTLLYQLGLLDTPHEGTIVVDGIDTSLLSRNERTALRLDRFGYVFQDYGLMSDMTAIDNVMVPLIMQGMSVAAAHASAHSALERVGLADRCEYRPSGLSGGQQQRVSIARAISHNPTYLFADEPTANLDSTNAENVMKLFGAIHAAGTAVIMVTHERESLTLASRILFLDRGTLTTVDPSTQSTSELAGGL